MATFATTRSGRRLTQQDLALAQDVAARTGLVVLNAWLYDDVRSNEQRLAEKVAELETLFAVAPVGIGIADDAEAREIRSNREFARMLRLGEGENASLTAPEDQRPRFRVFRDGRELGGDELPMQVAAATGQETERAQLDIVFDDGTEVHEYGSAAPLLAHDGTVRGAVGFFVDITQQEKQRRKLELLAELNQKFTELTTDPQRLVEMIAGSMCGLLGDACAVQFARDDMTLETVALRHRKPGAEGFVRELLELRPARADEGLIGHVFATGEAAFVPVIPADELRRGLPEVYWPYLDRYGVGSLVVAPLRIEGRVFGVLSLTRAPEVMPYRPEDAAFACEVAERASVAIHHARLLADMTQTAEELKKANAAKDDFLGLVSHELKTPITTILGNAEVLARRFDDLEAPARRSALEDIRADAERLHRIIDNLLVLARLERGQHVDREPLLLRKVVDRVVEAQRRGGSRRAVQVTGNGDIGLALASPDYVEQVLRNLLSNADKYSPAEAPVEIVFERDEREVVVRILDRGQGVEPEEADEIFAPFYRSARTSAQAQGVGIGLAVCKRLLDAQGGRLWASPRPGGGSEFGFSLPVVDDE
jgi:signal transduction histidine kinase/PAS domain-containing protein